MHDQQLAAQVFSSIIAGMCCCESVVSPSTLEYRAAVLEQQLIERELHYGGMCYNVPRWKVSKYDPRTREELLRGGMTGGDRMHPIHNHYAPIYARYLAPYVGQDIVFVEVGVLKGTGLAMWADVFPEADIVGLDIDLSHFKQNKAYLGQKGAFAHKNARVWEYDQLAHDNSRLLKKIFGTRRPSIVTDDGLHSDSAILNSLRDFMPYMADHFVYFIEDNKWVYQKIIEMYPQFNVNHFGLLTVITR